MKSENTYVVGTRVAIEVVGGLTVDIAEGQISRGELRTEGANSGDGF